MVTDGEAGQPSRRWSEQETRLALYLYFQLPFGQLHKGNPEIRDLAARIDRTPSSVAMKLVNFASLDPKIIESGRKGLGNASNLDRQVWREFVSNWTAEVASAERHLATSPAPDVERLRDGYVPFTFEQFERPSTAQAVIERRIGQGFFRRSVLANFDNKCCVTGIAEPRLLNASHILPWGMDVVNRHNPANGLSLSATFDRAFDQGLIAFDETKKLLLAPALAFHSDELTRDHFMAFEGRSMQNSRRFEPSPDFLGWHREHVFLAA